MLLLISLEIKINVAPYKSQQTAFHCAVLLSADKLFLADDLLTTFV